MTNFLEHVWLLNISISLFCSVTILRQVRYNLPEQTLETEKGSPVMHPKNDVLPRQTMRVSGFRPHISHPIDCAMIAHVHDEAQFNLTITLDAVSAAAPVGTFGFAVLDCIALKIQTPTREH